MDTFTELCTYDCCFHCVTLDVEIVVENDFQQLLNAAHLAPAFQQNWILSKHAQVLAHKVSVLLVLVLVEK